MKPSSPLAVVGAILMGIIILIFLANYLVSIRAVPSLGEYMASTTLMGDERSGLVAHEEIDGTKPSDFIDIQAPKGKIHATISDTPEERAKGLSGWKDLPQGEGMVFIFPEPGTYGFWMKDMNFPLDIIWIGADKKILGIESNVSPDTYPELFYPPNDVQYVLEMSAGSSQKFGLTTGAELVF